MKPITQSITGEEGASASRERAAAAYVGALLH